MHKWTIFDAKKAIYIPLKSDNKTIFFVGMTANILIIYKFE